MRKGFERVAWVKVRVRVRVRVAWVESKVAQTTASWLSGAWGSLRALVST
tara:strand:+ start:209 stop:358 length:150 start_codon:yes stop_codon:yes gene_type:complete